MNLIELNEKEGWKVIRQNGEVKVQVYDQLIKLNHPVQIHLKLYRDLQNPELKYQHMYRAFCLLWPELVATFNYWDELRFRTHCQGYKNISYAGGAGTGKSMCAAIICLLYWLANPRKRAVIVASTTLESLNSRIFGYCVNLISNMAVKLPYTYYSGNTPKILIERTDLQHGIFALAAKSGSDEKSISSWIGRHPKQGILVILDEATDIEPQVLNSLPNLESGVEEFQCVAIGNSNSKFDLHGSMSTPKNGWESVDPMKDSIWETTQKQGICLFFSAYNSPAIHEIDPIKKKKLSKFLITQDVLIEKEQLLGKDTDLFWRFVLGYWRSTTSENVVMSKQFLEGFDINEKAEWLGIKPLARVAGLDPAFSTGGGDLCVLQLSIVGQTVDGGVVLDYRGEDLLFVIKIKASHGRNAESAELQIARQVCDILQKYDVPLGHLAIDANGQGRALAGTIYLEMASRRGQLQQPLKIYSTRGGTNVLNSFGMIIKSTLELWEDLRKYIEHKQIKGIGKVAAAQLQHRLIQQDDKTKKQKLETKSEFKKRMGAVMPSLAHSPDEADAAALCLQSAIYNLGFSLGQRKEVPKLENTFMHEKLLANQAQNTIKIQQENNRPFTLAAGFSTSVEDFASQRKVF